MLNFEFMFFSSTIFTNNNVLFLADENEYDDCNNYDFDA